MTPTQRTVCAASGERQQLCEMSFAIYNFPKNILISHLLAHLLVFRPVRLLALPTAVVRGFAPGAVPHF